MDKNGNDHSETKKSVPLHKVVTWGGVGILAVIIIISANISDNSSLTAQSDVSVSAAATTPVVGAAAIKAKVHDYAVDPITPDQYPGLYRKLGKNGAAEATAGSYAAAYMAAASNKCDAVETADPSPDSTKRNLKFFVNCDNNQQFRFKANELKNGKGHWLSAEEATDPGESFTNIQKSKREELQSTAPGDMADCQYQIGLKLSHPASADFSLITGSSNTVDGDGNRVIHIDFDAKNAFGSELPYLGECVYKHESSSVDVNILNR